MPNTPDPPYIWLTSDIERPEAVDDQELREIVAYLVRHLDLDVWRDAKTGQISVEKSRD